ncbi:hypothetical protein GCM10010517_76670 [Streptosporangium fragile]|uniref:Uncharacterized protein n=1 Tax=Streptosporangium fragile TaxID=46186 RepID=A0ABP6IUK4_9ACTN
MARGAPLDAARLYRRALETASAGARRHGTADEGVAFREIAEVIGHHLSLPAVSIPPEQAPDHFGWFSFAVSADNPTSSSVTRDGAGAQALPAEHDHLRAPDPIRRGMTRPQPSGGDSSMASAYA